jgi:UTP--glucose-1-phosphate uridylyltransferase
VSPEKAAIRDYFAGTGALEELLEKKGKTDELVQIQKVQKLARFHFVEQNEPLGDGHAVLQARELVGNEHFFVLFGDDIVRSKVPVAAQLAAVHEWTGGPVVALQEVTPDQISSYGIVQPRDRRERLIEIGGFVEKPAPAEAPSNLGIVGKYICPPDIFEILAKSPSESGEIRLIDALAELAKSKSVFGLLFEGERFDTGSKAGYVEAFIAAALAHPETAERTKEYLKRIAAQSK